MYNSYMDDSVDDRQNDRFRIINSSIKCLVLIPVIS